ncbi:MAG: hypothetical protein AB8B93_05905 [Pseudomonadales bacterium]
MELKDITNEAELATIRGGYNSISQSSVNYGATGSVSVSGHGFNASPVDITSNVLQSNLTQQSAAIHDVYKRDTRLNVLGSQISAGFPFAL